MANSAPFDDDVHLREGERALLVMGGQRYLVRILQIDAQQMRVSYPVSGFPLESMHVDLEFHDESGYARYETDVLRTSTGGQEGLLLRRPGPPVRTQHRSTWRVPLALRVKIKGHTHPRWHDVDAVNLSAGGILLRIDQEIDLDDNYDIKVNLPEYGDLELLGKTAHLFNTGDNTGDRLVGMHFVGLEPAQFKLLAGYVARQLRQLYAEGGPRRRRSDR